MFGQFSRHCRNLILSKSFMHLGITIKDKLQNVWPVYTFTLDGLKGYVLITQYIFIIRWTPMDFPSGWCHPLGMCAYCLWKLWLLACWGANSEYLENFSCHLFYICYSFQKLFWKSSESIVSQQQGSIEIFFTFSRDAELWLLVISQCNALYDSSMTHVQVIKSHRNKITLAF